MLNEILAIRPDNSWQITFFEKFVSGKSRSLTKSLPMPAVPPRSPKKNIGPKPKPTSNLPSPVVMDWEWAWDENKFREINSASKRTAESKLFLIDSDFWFFLLLDFGNKIEMKNGYNEYERLFSYSCLIKSLST